MVLKERMSEIRKVKFNIRETKRKNNSKNGVISVETYHPRLSSLYGIIRKNVYLFNIDLKIKEVFSHNPWFLFVGPVN